MNKGIVISTWGGWEEPLDTLLASLRDYHKYPVYIVINDAKLASKERLQYLAANNTIFLNFEDGFELGALKLVYENTDLSEMILLQDTIEILDPTVFEGLFELEGFKGRVVAYGKHFLCYLGKYTRESLDKLPIPTIRNKSDALYWEHGFTSMLFRTEDEIMCFDTDFDDSNPKNYYDEKFGRKNLVLVSKYLVKRKNTIGPPLNNEIIDKQPDLINTALAVYTPLIVHINSTNEEYTAAAVEEYKPVADRIWVLTTDEKGRKDHGIGWVEQCDQHVHSAKEVFARNDVEIDNPWILSVSDTEYMPNSVKLNIRRFCDWPYFSKHLSSVKVHIGDKVEPRLKRRDKVWNVGDVFVEGDSEWSLFPREEVYVEGS